MDFNDLWFNHAMLMAKKSKDPRTQVGAVIVNREERIAISEGYNGPPRGYPDSKLKTLTKEEKALVCEHAERNAIYNAARMGRSTNKCDIYVTLTPCNECARAIIQAGIKKVWVPLEFNKGRPSILENLVDYTVAFPNWEFDDILIDGQKIFLGKPR